MKCHYFESFYPEQQSTRRNSKKQKSQRSGYFVYTLETHRKSLNLILMQLRCLHVVKRVTYVYQKGHLRIQKGAKARKSSPRATWAGVPALFLFCHNSNRAQWLFFHNLWLLVVWFGLFLVCLQFWFSWVKCVLLIIIIGTSFFVGRYGWHYQFHSY